MKTKRQSGLKQWISELRNEKKKCAKRIQRAKKYDRRHPGMDIVGFERRYCRDISRKLEKLKR
jgi:hypothetical protein